MHSPGETVFVFIYNYSPTVMAGVGYGIAVAPFLGPTNAKWRQLMNDSKEKLAALIHKQCALISIDTGYACAGVELDESGYVYKTAPIFKWMMHKSLREIKRWKNIKKIEVASTFDYDMSDKAYNPD